MRIISGTLGGRTLRSLPGGDTRPAMGRAREALFSMLEARGVVWDRIRVLDLFAGTGSLAFECLSRGAVAAVMVDNGREACRCLAANAEGLDLTCRCRIVCGDVLKFLRREPPGSFQLVFIDPPYRRDYLSPALGALLGRSWLTPGAFVSVEIERDARVIIPPGLDQVAERLLGQTWLRLFVHNPDNGAHSHEDSPVSGNV